MSASTLQRSGCDRRYPFITWLYDMLTYLKHYKSHTEQQDHMTSQISPFLPPTITYPSSRYSGMGHPPPPSFEPAVHPVRTGTRYPRSVQAKPCLPRRPETRRNDWWSRYSHCWCCPRRAEPWSWSSAEPPGMMTGSTQSVSALSFNTA